MSAVDEEIERLAIPVVYHLTSDDDLPLLDLHLDRIERHTHVPFTIYAATNRASAAACRTLRHRSWVVEAELASTELRGSREHGHYLDGLIRRALEDGASHVCTLDVDSFPVTDNWLERVQARTPEASGVAGVLRRENGDIALPHPSCVFMRRDFLERFAPSFSPDSDLTPDFRRFLRSTGQAGDTGIRVGYTLWSQQLPWGRLLRSNAWNPHPVIAGLYDDCIFHLGATASGTVFRRDLAASTVHRVTRPFARVPVPSPSLARKKRKLLDRVRARSEEQIKAGNREAFLELRAWLIDDPDGLFAHLRGQAHTDGETGLPARGRRCLSSPVRTSAERPS